MKDQRPMRHAKRLILLGCVLLFAACADTAPLTDPSFGFGSSWQTNTTTGVTGWVANEVPTGTVVHSLLAPPLTTYRGSFEAVQGRRTNFEILYTTGWTFLALEIPQSAQLVDETGRPLKRGEAVTITVDVDPVSYAVRFQPHGVTFPRHPARLTFGLTHADWIDHTLEDAEALDLWYQPTDTDSWTHQNKEIEFTIAGQWATTELDHFSNYAIAW